MNLKNVFKLEQKIINKAEKIATSYVDEIFYFGAVLSPLLTCPQLFKIFYYKSAVGVSLLTWFSYLLGAICLLVYGIVHKQKPIIWMNLTILPVYLGIIIGIILYS